MDTSEKAGTWNMVSHLRGKNVVGRKWVFCIKQNADGSIDKYKACLNILIYTITSSTKLLKMEPSTSHTAPLTTWLLMPSQRCCLVGRLRVLLAHLGCTVLEGE
jgi:hypothetical protein